jgi:hypothetical protein
MQLRSGATTGGTTPRGGIPDQIQIRQQPSQEEGDGSPGPRTPAMTPQVYTAGTYPAQLRRTPSVPADFRPAQFSFLPQPDYRTTGDPNDAGDVGLPSNAPSPAPQLSPSAAPQVQTQPAIPAQQNPSGAGIAMRGLSFEAPMRPLDVQRDMYLDYTNTQAIKFYNKGCEKLPGEAFGGKMLLTWLVQVQDKANMFTWTPILTIKGKLLTQHYTEITMEDVRAHAQVYQDRASRQAQNAEMLIQCLKASISRAVYNKVYLQRDRYTIYRRNTNEPVQDGVCFLKTIIDNYHSNTRSMTKQIRKQLASLNLYMKNVAKGDVKKLCQHTRELLYELDAAGEVTNDLLANLIEALKEAPDSNFQRWLSNQVDLWSMRKLDWKQDGSDLMEEAETYYQEAISTNRWGRKAHKQEIQYAFKSVESGEETEEEKEKKEKKEKSKTETGNYDDMMKALTAHIQEQVTAYTARWSGQSPNVQQDMDKKYAWKKVPPKDGEPHTKRMYVDGKYKVYYWCPNHLEWTIHKPSECRRLKPRKKTQDYKNKKVTKRQNFKNKKKAYIQAKAAYQAMLGVDSDEEQSSMDSDNDEGSNQSDTSYSSEGSNTS